VDLFLAAHETPPARIALELDAANQPMHGQADLVETGACMKGGWKTVS
jgi:hypothetical protein